MAASSDEGESREVPNRDDDRLKGDPYCCPSCLKEAARRRGNLGGNLDRDDSSVDSESSSDDDGDRKIAADETRAVMNSKLVEVVVN